MIREILLGSALFVALTMPAMAQDQCVAPTAPAIPDGARATTAQIVTTQNDINIKAVLRLKENLELNAFGQVEFWKAPVLASGQQHDFTGSFQLTYYPKLSWHR